MSAHDLEAAPQQNQQRAANRPIVRRIVFALALGAGAFFVTLLTANLIDWHRYTHAARFEEFVGIEKVRELSRTCFDLGKNGYVHLSEYPPIIGDLKPRWVSIDRDYAQIGLYAHGDASVFLVFSKYDGNEVVSICDYVRGPFEERLIYVQDAEKYELLHPRSRLVTLGESTMHENVEWIVLPDEIRVIAHPYSGGAVILVRSPITSDVRRKIEAAIRDIPRDLRGKRFHARVMDGITLGLCFETDGRRGPTDIELDNTWRDEVGPLVETVGNALPGDPPLRFREIIERDLRENPKEQFTISWSEQQKLDRPRLPWWCLWPRL